MIIIKERFQYSGAILVRESNPDRPIFMIDDGGLETYNEFRDDENKTRFIGVDES